MITDHLMHGWGLPICVWSSLASQERLSNRPAQQPNMFPIGVSKRSRHSCGGVEGHWDGAVKNWRVSEDHRPATSPPKTTKRHLPPSPDRQLRARSDLAPPRNTERCAAPSVVAAPALAVPSLLMALTRVASMASCAPPKSGGHLQRLPDVAHPTCRSHHAQNGEAPADPPLPLRNSGGQGC